MVTVYQPTGPPVPEDLNPHQRPREQLKARVYERINFLLKTNSIRKSLFFLTHS